MGIFNKKKQKKQEDEETAEVYLNLCKEFYEEGKQKEAFTMAEKAAKKFDHSVAYMQLGIMYENGEGVNANYGQALAYYKIAASKGDALAQYNTGRLYDGKGTQLYYEEAIRWYRMASDNECTLAPYALGLMYQYGRGVEVDHKEAFQWYQKSASLGQYHAQYSLGCAYLYGLGVAKNYEKAFEWYATSAKNSNDSALMFLGIMYLYGIGVDVNYDEAINCFTKSKHNRISSLSLVYMYENGPGVPRNEKKAKKYFDKELNNGQVDIMYTTGFHYIQLRPILQSSIQALYWLEKAAEKGSVDALVALGALYLTDEADGAEQNIVKAFGYLSQAAKIEQVHFNLDQLVLHRDRLVENENAMKWYYKTSNQDGSVKKGCISGLSCQGYLYYKGIGVRQNFSKALELYLTVLHKLNDDSSDANMCLGLLYSKGLGVEQDHRKAMKYFERSAKKVNTYAYNLIGDAYKFGNGVEKDLQKALERYMKGVKYNDEYSHLNVSKIHLQVSADKGCKEAREYTRLIESAPLLTAEEKLRKVTAELRRIDPNNKVLLEITTSVSSLDIQESFQFFHVEDSTDKS